MLHLNRLAAILQGNNAVPCNHSSLILLAERFLCLGALSEVVSAHTLDELEGVIDSSSISLHWSNISNTIPLLPKRRFFFYRFRLQMLQIRHPCLCQYRRGPCNFVCRSMQTQESASSLTLLIWHETTTSELPSSS